MTAAANNKDRIPRRVRGEVEGRASVSVNRRALRARTPITERHLPCTRKTHVTTLQPEHRADAARPGVRLRALPPGRTRRSPGHQAPQPLSVVPLEPARRPAPGRQARGMQGAHGAHRRVGPTERRMVHRAPLPAVWRDANQSHGRRRQRAGLDVARRSSPGSATVPVGSTGPGRRNRSVTRLTHRKEVPMKAASDGTVGRNVFCQGIPQHSSTRGSL